MKALNPEVALNPQEPRILEAIGLTCWCVDLFVRMATHSIGIGLKRIRVQQIHFT